MALNSVYYNASQKAGSHTRGQLKLIHALYLHILSAVYFINGVKISYSATLAQVEAAWQIPDITGYLGEWTFSFSFPQDVSFLFPPKWRFQQNTATGCCSAPVQWVIRQHVQNAGDRPSYPFAPTRIRTNQTACPFRTHARPTTSAGKNAQSDHQRGEAQWYLS